MLNAIVSKTIATLLVATIVLSGCSAADTNITAANDAGAIGGTTEMSGSNADGNASTTSNNTGEILGLVAGAILAPLILVWWADQQE